MIQEGRPPDTLGMPSIASPRLLAAAALAGLAVAAAGCGSGGGSGSTAATPTATTAAASSAASAKGGPVTVAYKNFQIDPAKITVAAGTKITWTNADGTRHNVVTKDGSPAAFTSKDFDKGQTVTYTPTKPGVYHYLCTFHPATMQGEIDVVK